MSSKAVSAEKEVDRMSKIDQTKAKEFNQILKNAGVIGDRFYGTVQIGMQGGKISSIKVTETFKL